MNDLPRKPLDDAAFVAALSLRRFRRTTEIAREMLKAGTPAPLSAIRLRMAEFVREGGGAVEARGDSWRLTPDYQPVYAAPQSRPYKLVSGDGLALLRSLPDCSVDLLLADLPYGITGSALDSIIDLDAWMEEMHRVVTLRGAIVAFGAGSFTTDLSLAGRAFNVRKEKFEKDRLVWAKNTPSGFPLARARHLTEHEDILVFSKGVVIAKRSKRQMIYNPQGAVEVPQKARPRTSLKYLNNVVRGYQTPGEMKIRLKDCPRSILHFDKDGSLHPYQKPVALLEYLIRTYTNADAVVCDPSMGSGSAGVAALQTGRRFIGAEIDAAMFAVSKARIEKVFCQPQYKNLLDLSIQVS